MFITYEFICSSEYPHAISIIIFIFYCIETGTGWRLIGQKLRFSDSKFPTENKPNSDLNLDYT